MWEVMDGGLRIDGFMNLNTANEMSDPPPLPPRHHKAPRPSRQIDSLGYVAGSSLHCTATVRALPLICNRKNALQSVIGFVRVRDSCAFSRHRAAERLPIMLSLSRGGGSPQNPNGSVPTPPPWTLKKFGAFLGLDNSRPSVCHPDPAQTDSIQTQKPPSTTTPHTQCGGWWTGGGGA